MWRKKRKLIVSKQALLPTAEGLLKSTAFGIDERRDNLFLEIGDITTVELPLIRMHSECITSEVFGSLKCDCKQQLDESIKLIRAHGNGAVIYLRQEGRGIGLFNKIEAYHLQEYGYDTIEANLRLHLDVDLRNYELAALLLKTKGVYKIQLITNNNDKVNQLRRHGIEVDSIIKMPAQLNQHNENYINTKIVKLKHTYELS